MMTGQRITFIADKVSGLYSLSSQINASGRNSSLSLFSMMMLTTPLSPVLDEMLAAPVLLAPASPPIVEPLAVAPDPSAYYGLLTDPVGRYGRAPYGAAMAFTLRGSPLFVEKAHTLFDSFGGEIINGPKDGSRPRWRESRPVVLRSTPNPEVWFFCMPPARVKIALKTYFYCQIYRAKGIITPILDEDGDRIDSTCSNEGEIDREAAVLAETFYRHEIYIDYAALPEYYGGGRPAPEHDLMEAASEDEEGQDVRPECYTAAADRSGLQKA